MESETLVIPCTYQECNFRHPDFPEKRIFKVTLFVLLEIDDIDPKCYVFLHESDQRDNYFLARELGKNVEYLDIPFIVTEFSWPSLWNQIISYENVLESKGIKKRQSKYTYSKH